MMGGDCRQPRLVMTSTVRAHRAHASRRSDPSLLTPTPTPTPGEQPHDGRSFPPSPSQPSNDYRLIPRGETPIDEERDHPTGQRCQEQERQNRKEHRWGACVMNVLP